MLNPYLNTWNIKQDPPDIGVPLFILIERDVLDPSNVLSGQPFIRYASYHQHADYNSCISYWKLLDYDPEEEEQILRQDFSVVGWRYAGNSSADDLTIVIKNN